MTDDRQTFCVEDGLPVGIEILFTSQFIAPADLTSVTVNIAQPVDGLLTPALSK